MAKKVELKERGTNETMYPVTSLDCVVDSNTLIEKVNTIEQTSKKITANMLVANARINVINESTSSITTVHNNSYAEIDDWGENISFQIILPNVTPETNNNFNIVEFASHGIIGDDTDVPPLAITDRNFTGIEQTTNLAPIINIIDYNYIAVTIYIQITYDGGYASTTFNCVLIRPKIKRPISYIIDQTSDSTPADEAIISRGIVYPGDIWRELPDNDFENDTILWLKKNSHAYVGRYVNDVLRLKQLSDNSRKLFNDGTSSLQYINGGNGNYDVFMKFPCDIYYRGELVSQYVYKITIATELPEDKYNVEWDKFSQYKLIGVYKASISNEKMYSVSGTNKTNKIIYDNCVVCSKNKGKHFDFIDYDTRKILALLGFAYYKTISIKDIVGRASSNETSEEIIYSKVTGITDYLGMNDTTLALTQTPTRPTDEAVIAGIGDNVTSTNFWGLENFYGELLEQLSHIRTMQIKSSSGDLKDSKQYIYDYLEDYGGEILITKSDGTDIIANITNIISIYPDFDRIFMAILDDDDERIIRLIDTAAIGRDSGVISKLLIGNHCDIISIERDGKWNTFYGSLQSISNSTYVAFNEVYSSGDVVTILCNPTSNDPISTDTPQDRISSRLIYNGNENNVYIIEDDSETL